MSLPILPDDEPVINRGWYLFERAMDAALASDSHVDSRLYWAYQSWAELWWHQYRLSEN